MKSVDVKSSRYIDFDKKNIKNDPQLKNSNHVRISKYKSIFAKGCVPNWYEEVFMITKVKTILLWTYVISDVNGEEIFGKFYKKELQKINKKNLE